MTTLWIAIAALLFWLGAVRRHKRQLFEVNEYLGKIAESQSKEITELTAKCDNREAALRVLYANINSPQGGLRALAQALAKDSDTLDEVEARLRKRLGR